MTVDILSFESLDPKEQVAVTELRGRMKDCMPVEMYSDLSIFVRFLRARDLNVNAAEAMLRNHLEWRKANQVDNILKNYTPKEVVVKYLPMNNIGIAKNGSPVIYFDVGNFDFKGIFKSCRKSDIIKYIIQLLEENVVTTKEESSKRNTIVDKWIMILNFSNMTLSLATHKETLELVGSLISMYEANYPERLKSAYFINVSFYFTLAFSVIKHFISERTYNKIRFYGSSGFSSDLLDIISEDVLPAFLGGKRTDPDGNPACKTIISCGFVDERYFVNKKLNTIANLPGVKKLNVTRMSKIQIPLYVKYGNSYIEWEFETKNRDIAFSVIYKKYETDDEIQEIIPKQRIDTYMSSETGTVKCENTGVYIIEFDNSFSWIFNKELYYRIAVVEKKNS